MNLVLGSGPAGVAAAAALLSRDQPVTMLDGGDTLEGEKQELVTHLAAHSPLGWAPGDIASLKGATTADARGVPKKLVYGSSFPYADLAAFGVEQNNVAFFPSLARGGLSNVWGGAMLPSRDRDLGGWPIGTEALRAGYAAINQLIPASGQDDDLDALFSVPLPRGPALSPSRQGKALLASLAARGDILRASGIHFGAARLAVHAAAEATRPGCAYCGLCLYGCPYGLIYRSQDTLRALARSPHFRYVPGVLVKKIIETDDGVRLLGEGRGGGEPLQWTGERVFVAAGVIPTARLVLTSLTAYDRALALKYSQYFLLPLLAAKRTVGAANEPLHTLAQAFIEIDNPEVSANSVHLQFYGYNDLYAQGLKNVLKLFYSRALVAPLLERLLVFQGYLHSDESPTITLTLKRAGDALIMEGGQAAGAQRVTRRLTRLLRQNKGAFGAFPLFAQLGAPGAGYHNGGTFPMRQTPGAFETDIWGRLPGWSRTHIVDASILPSVPATTITLTVMANAYRIAAEAAARVVTGSAL